MRYVKITLISIALLVMSVWAMLLYRDAIIAWWRVPGIGLAIGLATGLHLWKMWRGITDTINMAFNYICHTVATAIVVTFAFFITNDLLSDKSTSHTETAVVGAHYKEEHHRTRRVGRRYTATGEKYYTYKLGIDLPDGRSKLVDVPISRYQKVRNGDSVTVTLRQGGLGVTIIDTDSIKFHTKKKAKSKAIPRRRTLPAR